MKVLVVRIDGLGDTVLTTPLLRLLNEAGHEVTVVASPMGAQCLYGHPGVRDVLCIDPRGALSEKLALRKRLGGFDAALVVTEKAWGYLWASGARRRIGFSSGSVQPLKSAFFERTLTEVVPAAHDSGLHEVERILRLAEPLGLYSPPTTLWLPHVAVGVEPEDTIAVHLSAKWLSDGYDIPWLRELIASLGKVCLSFGPAESRIAASLRDAAPPLAAGDFSTWCANLRRCKLVVTMDTGVVHVASALGIPVVDVFPSEPLIQWLPWRVPNYLVERGPRSDEESRRVLAEVVEASRALAQDPNHDL